MDYFAVLVIFPVLIPVLQFLAVGLIFCFGRKMTSDFLFLKIKKLLFFCFYVFCLNLDKAVKLLIIFYLKLAILCDQLVKKVDKGIDKIC